jgi:hypothetical protein
MNKKDFLSHVESLSIDRHILGGKRGAEENVKIKIIVPLLQCLGWDLLDDMHFEYVGADIVLFSEEKPSIIIETKSWGEVITGHERGIWYKKSRGNLFNLILGNHCNFVSWQTAQKNSRSANEKIRDRTGDFCSLYAGELEGQGGRPGKFQDPLCQ